MKNIAILASGSGTNADNIIRFFDNSLYARVALVLSDNPRAGVHARAAALKRPSFSFSREEFRCATSILAICEEYAIDFVVLAGFLTKVSAPIINAFPNKIVNIHPALLPKYGGKGMYGMHVHRAVLESGDSESGITIHYINEYYDEGAIIFQASCPVMPGDMPDELAARVHQLEYTHYPVVIAELLKSI
ncbi:MAG: phosphoribosylglycinamide formyltransferase [Tannerellaceae bacterium]|jgi:phosphoribosylglycinamide formyltransferase-1|nr:phosphoribosylglycinamide formyltransferase [Tannerellaceae bacterium]